MNKSICFRFAVSGLPTDELLLRWQEEADYEGISLADYCQRRLDNTRKYWRENADIDPDDNPDEDNRE